MIKGASPLKWRTSKAYPGASSAKARSFIAWRYELPEELEVAKEEWIQNPEGVIDRLYDLVNDYASGFHRNYTRHRKHPRVGKKSKYGSHAKGKYHRRDYIRAQLLLVFDFDPIASKVSKLIDQFSYGNVDVLTGKDRNEFDDFVRKQFNGMLSRMFNKNSLDGVITIKSISWHWMN